jgi:hypothetical protein
VSRLPQPGDAIKASRILNGRMRAGAGATAEDEMVTTGTLTITPDGVAGSGLPTVLAIYGDLYDVHETINEAGWARLVLNHEREVEAGDERLIDALVALVLQATAFGVLMERNRWERGS